MAEAIKEMLQSILDVQEFLNSMDTTTFLFEARGFHAFLEVQVNKKRLVIAHKVVKGEGITEEYFIEQLAKIGKSHDKIEYIDMIYGHTLTKEELKKLITVL